MFLGIRDAAEGREAEPQREEGAEGGAEAGHEAGAVDRARDGQEEQEYPLRHLQAGRAQEPIVEHLCDFRRG